VSLYYYMVEKKGDLSLLICMITIEEKHSAAAGSVCFKFQQSAQLIWKIKILKIHRENRN